MKKPTDLPKEHQELLRRIGAKLRTMRKEQNKGYEKMAEDIGIPRNTYNLMELGKINCQFSTLLQVITYHQLSISDFFKDL